MSRLSIYFFLRFPLSQDVEQLLTIIGGDQEPQEWRGDLPGLEYRLGPGFDTANG